MMDQARGPARSVQLIDQTLALSLPGIAVVGNDREAGIRAYPPIVEPL